MTAEPGSYDRQVNIVSAAIRSNRWDQFSDMERVNLLLAAEDLAIDPVEHRAAGWQCTEQEARIRLTWWLAQVRKRLQIDREKRKAS